MMWIALQRAVALNKGSSLAKGLCKHTPKPCTKAVALYKGCARCKYCTYSSTTSAYMSEKKVLQYMARCCQAESNMLCKQNQVQPEQCCIFCFNFGLKLLKL